MPDLVGLSLADAAGKLKKIGLDYELDGEGQYILRQLPPENTQIPKGTTVVLIT